MTDAEEKSQEAASSGADTLYSIVQHTLNDRSDWETRVDEWRTARLLSKTHGKQRTPPYPGAPNMAEPIIDDNVTCLTSAENSILWSSRVLAVFLPLSPSAQQHKRLAECAFDTLLRITLSVRAKVENLFDQKNECGMGLAKLTENRKVMRGEVLPDFEPVDPLDVVVPTDTKRVRDAEWVVHICRYAKRRFREEAKSRDWKNAEKVLAYLRERALGDGDSESGSEKSRVGLADMPSSTEQVTVWEQYHWKREGGAYKKYVTIYCPDAPQHVLNAYQWKWDDTYVPQTVVDQATGMPTVEVKTVVGDDRPWPFVQFRYENRSEYYYDTRGVAEKLKYDQKEASANKTAKAVMMDYCCKPFLTGSGSAAGFRFRPGDVLPQGMDFAIPPRVDPIFDYNMDLSRAAAARRVGSPQGSFSSLDKGKDAKTATEVSQTALTHNMLSSDSVERFSESLGELFNLMWDYLTHNPVAIPAVIGKTATVADPAIYEQDFIIVPGVSGKSANPDLLLRQLMTLGQLFSQFPQMGQFVRGADLAQLVFDQIDPKLTPSIVIEPQQAGPLGAPIEQVVGQLMQVVFGEQGKGGLVNQTQNNSAYLAAMAQAEQADEGGGEVATPSTGAVPQPGVQ